MFAVLPIGFSVMHVLTCSTLAKTVCVAVPDKYEEKFHVSYSHLLHNYAFTKLIAKGSKQ